MNWGKTAQWFLTNGISVAPILRMWNDPEHEKTERKLNPYAPRRSRNLEPKAQKCPVCGGTTPLSLG